MLHWKVRVRAAAIHLGISLAVALLAAMLVFVVWYPAPYGEISGGRELFLILVTVDVLLGPLITLAIFNRAKPRRELRRDLAVVVLIQLLALGYGLWTVFVARPVHLVFEIDRYRVVHAVDVPPELLNRMPAGIDPFPLRGPTMLAVRPFRSRNEEAEATIVALQGIPIGTRPDFWQPYADARAQVLQAARPVDQLKSRFPARAAEIDAALARAGCQPATTLYLPLAGRKTFWTAFVDPASTDVVAFLALDSF
ncbi:TfpX/TfpZ family type IV pilin accessory protein [Caenimonas terrae]|uniref:TfpX/TfpZ family type IV pilin accessory protein n=1 Tax=Caenimonas terrae TaxID=696074 RepID=A0ABW0NBZ1_9BURK